MRNITFLATVLLVAVTALEPWAGIVYSQELTPEELKIVREAEKDRTRAVEKAMPSVVAVYGNDRAGGGSGVLIDPSGLALTNHHVIVGAGVEGWGGLADGKLYRWKLIGTDPGGDVALIQLKNPAKNPPPFPYSHLGDSDTVRVGDWALAMGNPFTLTEDQKPTVTLGIVSGVQRYQEGAGENQLVYGNCIQVDSSINPGNSGGPLFNMNAEVIGINGRGSFQDRGRVNVGLGYAISSNQIKNFIPDLLATKLVEHGTLDANFDDRDGKVVCSQINRDAPAAKAGLELGDELISFEGVPIDNANQYTNLICTYPEDWPTKLTIRKSGGQKELTINVRMYGLPYAKPSERPADPEGDDPDEKRAIEMQQKMFDLLAAEPGTVRKKKLNAKFTKQLIASCPLFAESERESIEIFDLLMKDGKKVGECRTVVDTDGRFNVQWTEGDVETRYVYDGQRYAMEKKGKLTEISLTECKVRLPIVQAIACTSSAYDSPFSAFGDAILDGSGKATSKNAYRLQLLDEDDDWFYVWMSMYDEDGVPFVQLLKAAGDIDCEHNDGGMAFDDWKQHEGWQLPHVKTIVKGLAETASITMETQQVTKLGELDESRFEIVTETSDEE